MCHSLQRNTPRLHGHFGLQFPELFFLVVFCLGGGFPFDCNSLSENRTANGDGETQTCLRSRGQGANLVADGHMSRREQVVLKLLLLHGLELALELVFVDSLHA